MKKFFLNRLDYFIIWPNGTSSMLEIIDHIADNKFDILRIIEFKIHNMNKFLKIIYSHDYAPYFHLRAKLKYLKKLNNKKVIIIFVLNKNSRSFIKKTNGYDHIESKTMNKVKWEIRNKYNERENGQINHNHVIHGTDSESQAIHLLNKLQIDPKEIIRENWIFPNHIQEFSNYCLKVVRLEDLKFRILNKNQVEIKKIEDTPHFKFLNGETELYKRYIEENLGNGIKKYHSPKKYKGLYELSKKSSNIFDPIVINKNMEVFDGNHRASIKYFIGDSKINAIIKK